MLTYKKIHLVFISLSIFLMCFSCACSVKSKNNQSEPMKILSSKPIFTLKLSAFGTRYFASVNGVSVYSEYSPEAQVDTVFPVNHYIHPVNNIISIEVFPDDFGEKVNPNARVRVELWVSSADPSIENEYLVSSIYFSGGPEHLKRAREESGSAGTLSSIGEFNYSSDGDVEIDEIDEKPIDTFDGAFSLHRKISIPNSLPLWQFFGSEKLPIYELLPDDEYENALAEAFPKLQVIQKALGEGTEEAVDRIMPLFEERSRETDKAFYLPDGETQAGLREEFVYAITSKTQSLVDLKQEYLALIVENNNLLLSLKRDGSRHAIVFNDSLYDGSNRFPIMFRRENGEWIITR